MDVSLKEWTKKCCKIGVQVGEGMYLHSLLFADDQVMIANDEEDINYMARNLAEEYRKWGLEINIEKTEYMTASPHNECEIDGRKLNKDSSFKYLSSYLQVDGIYRKEGDKRKEGGA
uniref:Reverse transcriptase domain-containing protein n=1 Tax=Rhodnius prolixus TaxID=13249 RepID=T1H9Z7_RHOPR